MRCARRDVKVNCMCRNEGGGFGVAESNVCVIAKIICCQSCVPLSQLDPLLHISFLLFSNALIVSLCAFFTSVFVLLLCKYSSA